MVSELAALCSFVQDVWTVWDGLLFPSRCGSNALQYLAFDVTVEVEKRVYGKKQRTIS